MDAILNPFLATDAKFYFDLASGSMTFMELKTGFKTEPIISQIGGERSYDCWMPNESMEEAENGIF